MQKNNIKFMEISVRRHPFGKILRKLKIRESGATAFLVFDFYFSVQSLSTSWNCNRLIINVKKGKKNYFSKSGLQTLDNQHDFFSCKRVGNEHADNQAQYRVFVNDLGLNKKWEEKF